MNKNYIKLFLFLSFLIGGSSTVFSMEEGYQSSRDLLAEAMRRILSQNSAIQNKPTLTLTKFVTKEGTKETTDSWREIAYSPCGRFIAYVDGQIVKIWDIEHNKVLEKELPKVSDEDTQSFFTWSPQGTFFSMVPNEFQNELWIYKVATLLDETITKPEAIKIIAHTFDNDPFAEINVVAWSPHEQYIAVSADAIDFQSQLIEIWDIKNSQNSCIKLSLLGYDPLSEEDNEDMVTNITDINTLRWSSDGNTLIAMAEFPDHTRGLQWRIIYDAEKIVFIKPTDVTILDTFEITSYINDCIVGQKYINRNLESTYVLDLNDTRTPRVIPQTSASAVSPDGRFLVTVDETETILSLYEIKNLKNPLVQVSLQLEDGSVLYINNLFWSPTDDYLALQLRESKIVIWNFSTNTATSDIIGLLEIPRLLARESQVNVLRLQELIGKSYKSLALSSLTKRQATTTTSVSNNNNASTTTSSYSANQEDGPVLKRQKTE